MITRRKVLKRAVLAGPFLPRAFAIHQEKNPRDIIVERVNLSFEEFLYRAPYMFGGRSVDRVTLLNVRCRVMTRDGRTAAGFGSMPLGNVWSFPSKVMSYDTTLGAMTKLADRIAGATVLCCDYAHPIEIQRRLEPEYLKAAAEVSQELKLASPIPKLCMLVAASPLDAAIHDAYGKVHGLNCYSTYGADFMSQDLSAYLGSDFKGEYLDRYVLKKPTARLPLFHSIGASDPLVASDIRKRINDGLPETLPDWIQYNGLTHFKIKLNGGDLPADLDRTIRIDRFVRETQAQRRASEWRYCLDFNENCPNVDYLLEFLKKLKVATPEGFRRILYIEQPTARDLKADRSNVMHEAAKLRPVVIDESLTDLEALLLAREMGYSGVALKACKGQSQAVLMAAAGQKYRMFLCVQDLTCPGASLIHSAGLAAHVPGVSGIEANAREYVPAANKPWEGKFPGLFNIRDGRLDTSGLVKPGLSAVED